MTTVQKSAQIYQYRGFLILRTISRQASGMWKQDGPFQKLLLSCPDHELGNALLERLSLSRSGLQTPGIENGLKVNSELYTATGVKSWITFQRNALLISVDLEAGPSIFTFEPNEKVHNGRGYVPISESCETLPGSSTPEEIGAAVRRALAKCR